MKSIRFLRAAMLALAYIVADSTIALAAPEDYEFQLVDDEIKQGNGVIAVRLVDKRSGNPVEDAVVFATRMDMAPDGMEAMTSPVEALPSDQPGVYRFKTNLSMVGNWRFSIAAKVQGEADTVESRLEFKAVQ